LFRATSAHGIWAFRAFPSRPAATPLDARCSRAVSASSGFTRASPSSAVAPASECLGTSFRLSNENRSACSCNLDIGAGIIRSSYHRSGRRTGRAAETADEGSTQSAQYGASESAKGRLKHPPAGVSLRLQSVAPVESPFSKRSPLGSRSSRCSLDLFPLRGVPTHPLGLRPPLMCLLRREPQHLAVPRPVPSRHFRVSIRLSLRATPKTGSNLLGVPYLFRSPKTLRQSRANPRLPSKEPSRKRERSQRADGCHSL
jgi:hypothetical protein